MVGVWNRKIEAVSRDEAEALRVEDLQEQLPYGYWYE